MQIWQLQDARSHFKDLFDRALAKGPQRVTRHGKEAVIVVSEEEWRQVTRNVPAFGKLLAASPLRDEELPPRRPARVIRGGTFD